MSGFQIENLHKAREQAKDLTSLLEHFPCWVFEEGDNKTLFDSLDKIRAILNTTEDWRNLNG
jgi:CHAD domain-containing protein